MEIHFEKVTSDNRKAVENLQVFAEQQAFIESMAENLKRIRPISRMGIGRYL